ncbi:threonine synthase [Clostridia bacterium]|nr:threonine synthase [Clostridia bacterium]
MNDIKYVSTRGGGSPVSASEAIVHGIAEDGGLYFPDKIPKLDLKSLRGKRYTELAQAVFGAFLSDFTPDEIREIVNSSYLVDNFDVPDTVRLCPVGSRYVLELWHGPTCAFKDMALQALPHLLRCSALKVFGGKPKRIKILTATSGDTGKAALEGFRDVSGVDITVYYPVNGVSGIQKRQMITQEGGNVNVIAVAGNFDDCQTAVKSIFTNDDIRKVLKRKNAVFSSANSINWGRLLPQIVYYFYAYLKLTNDAEDNSPLMYFAGRADSVPVKRMKRGPVPFGAKINFAVPTGNFGNILAGYISKAMGLPVDKLICASNANNILSDFINTGVYDANRKFHCTASPSMDILVSSNLERAIYYASGRDTALTAKLMCDLRDNDKYKVGGNFLARFRETFRGGFGDDLDAFDAIKTTFDEFGYLADTHTAVALRVHDEYASITGDRTPTVVLSTAHPYKFGNAVYRALEDAEPNIGEYKVLRRLAELTGVPVPDAIAWTERLPVRFSDNHVISGGNIIADFMQRLG